MTILNFLHIIYFFLFPEMQDFSDVYIVGEVMDADLYKIIQSSQIFTPAHVRYFMYQIFCALKYLHSLGVVVRTNIYIFLP